MSEDILNHEWENVPWPVLGIARDVLLFDFCDDLLHCSRSLSRSLLENLFNFFDDFSDEFWFYALWCISSWLDNFVILDYLND